MYLKTATTQERRGVNIVNYDFTKNIVKNSDPKIHSMWKYNQFLPISDVGNICSLGEGTTPLKEIALKDKKFWLKLEGYNPTGSFKDRGVSVLVSYCMQNGIKDIYCASTGNRAISLGTYCSKAGLTAHVMASESVLPVKLEKIIESGASIRTDFKDFDEATEYVNKLKNKMVLNSANIFRAEGQKTIIFEIFQQYGNKLPEYIFLPVGAGGHCYSLFMGLCELESMGLIETFPKIVGIQLEGWNPIYRKFKRINSFKPKKSELASGIHVNKPMFKDKTIEIINRTGGNMVTVSDSDISKIIFSLEDSEFKELVSEEFRTTGLASIAGYLKLGIKSENVVCIVTE